MCLVIAALRLIFEAIWTAICALLLTPRLLIEVEEVIELIPHLLRMILIPRRAALPGPLLPLDVLPEPLPGGLIILPLLVVRATFRLRALICLAHALILIVRVDPPATGRPTEVHVLEGGAAKTHLLVIGVLLKRV